MADEQNNVSLKSVSVCSVLQGRDEQVKDINVTSLYRNHRNELDDFAVYAVTHGEGTTQHYNVIALRRSKFFAPDGTEIVATYNEDGTITVAPHSIAFTTKRVLYNEIYHAVDVYVDGLRAIHYDAQVFADTRREVAGVAGYPAEVFVRTRRAVTHTERYSYDTERRVLTHATEYVDSKRALAATTVFPSDTVRRLANSRFTVIADCVDTKRILNSIPKGTQGYVDCKEIDLGGLYDISLVLDIGGTGYAMVAYADEGHSYGDFETYYEHEVTCRYIKIRLYVRGYIDKAQADIVASYYEESQDVEVSAGGVAVEFTHHYFHAPTIYVDNTQVNGECTVGNYRISDVSSAGLTITPVASDVTKLVTVKAKGV